MDESRRLVHVLTKDRSRLLPWSITRTASSWCASFAHLPPTLEPWLVCEGPDGPRGGPARGAPAMGGRSRLYLREKRWGHRMCGLLLGLGFGVLHGPAGSVGPIEHVGPLGSLGLNGAGVTADEFFPTSVISDQLLTAFSPGKAAQLVHSNKLSSVQLSYVVQISRMIRLTNHTQISRITSYRTLRHRGTLSSEDDEDMLKSDCKREENKRALNGSVKQRARTRPAQCKPE
ncbi:hypothetical protein F511_43518 [Dorcoceras hygrometricum]|uniref:Uncharacterized protein n=1 Tax=Dorcoceras hygrometricum TaxID=472368 RepID=A0A2Z6ZYS7_9LAMI|nr:hypothetical protein F511_43518 [Dorcoceras hygrometricum]